MKTSANSAKGISKGLEYLEIHNEQKIQPRKSIIGQVNMQNNEDYPMPKISFIKQQPWVIINGLAMGKRTFTYSGKSWVKSPELNLFCELLFDPNDAASSWFSSARTDTIVGVI